MKKNKTSKNWLRKKHKDLYFKQSKIEGYRSRSAYKLIEINKKFNLLKKNTHIIDLGSFPGGWSQVVSKKVTAGKILAIDIKSMDKIKNVDFLNGNFLDDKFFEKVLLFFSKKIDVVISDMAVNTSGNKDLDSYNTGQLCLKAMDLAEKILRNDGIFLSKLFMGSIYPEINEKANKYFKKVVKFKPESSRKESREIYIYCKGLSKSFNFSKV